MQELVTKLAVTAAQKLNARVDHLWGKGELLAIESEHVTILLQSLLIIPAFVLKFMDPLILSFHRVPVLADFLSVQLQAFEVDLDHLLRVLDQLLHVHQIVLQILDFVFKSLERDHEVSFRFNALVVFLLIENLVLGVKGADFVREFPRWRFNEMI